MDLNDLYHGEQVSLMRADAASSVEARLSHAGSARGYAERIRRVRGTPGALHAVADLAGEPA